MRKSPKNVKRINIFTWEENIQMVRTVALLIYHFVVCAILADLTALSMIGYWHHNVCLSVCLSVCNTVHSTAKVSEQVNKKCPQEYDFATFNHLRQA